MVNPLAADLDHILVHTEGLWEELRGQNIFITGGTGFFGCWLLESFAWANDKFELNSTAWVLTRNSNAFKAKCPHLSSHQAIKFHFGDVKSFEFPDESFSHIIHAATEVSTQSNENGTLSMLDTITQGTRHTLEFAKHCGARKFLLTSSGAVYGKQPPEITHISEDYQGAPEPTNPSSVYGEGKRLSELLCTIYAKKYNIEAKIARCFAFVGPYLALDSHFAIGNFIRDRLKGYPIQVKGDGTPYRSYLYAADLAIWLWTILFKGESCYPYNVGSNKDITVSGLAKIISEVFEPFVEVQIAKAAIASQPAERYVPSIQRALSSLQLQQTIDLYDSIKRSVLWYSQVEVNHAVI